MILVFMPSVSKSVAFSKTSVFVTTSVSINIKTNANAFVQPTLHQTVRSLAKGKKRDKRKTRLSK